MQCNGGYLSCCNQQAIRILALSFLGMKPDIDKATNSWINLPRLYESDEDFKSAFLLGGEKEVCGANMLCVHTAFGQFSLNLVWTSRIPTPLADEHLMVEMYRGCVNGFIQRKEKQICRLVYLHDYFIKGMRAVSKTVQFTFSVTKPRSPASLVSLMLKLVDSWL